MSKAESQASGVPAPEPTIERFREWLAEKDDFNHSYSRKSENKRFARGKDVDRAFLKEYDAFTTVLLTYCAGKPTSVEDIVSHSKRLFPTALVRKRRYLLKKLGVWQECAGVSVIAPKHRVPGAESTIPFSHGHTFLWLPGEWSEEDFKPLIDTHIRKVEGATEANHGDGAISVEVHDSEEVRTPLSTKARGSDMDSERGATTPLPQELGGNLPMLLCKHDARGAPDYVEEWAAHMRLGSDGKLSTKGIRRFRPFGRFNNLADRMRTERRLREAQAGAMALSSALGLDHRVPAPESTKLSGREEAFVEAYCEQAGDPSEKAISKAIDRNEQEIWPGAPPGDREPLIEAIQVRID